MSPSELIKQMKEMNSMSVKMGRQKSNSCKLVQHPKELDYIFVQPKVRSQQAMKEKNLIEFLNSEGVFQINLGVAMKEY